MATSLGLYILDGHRPVECEDASIWSRWMERADRHVKETIAGRIRVSTVFLGLDHNFGGRLPLLFETMAFVDGKSSETARYSTWDEAEAGHAEMVRLVISKAYV